MIRSAIRRWAVGPVLVLGLVGCEVLGILPVDAACNRGQPTTLQVTSPLGGTSLPAGTDVTVAVAYQAGSWAYDTLEVYAGSTLIGAERLTSAAFSGGFTWLTTGLVPGPVQLKVVAVDRVSTRPCHDRASPEVTVQIDAAAPTISRQPSDASSAEGGTATFDVGVRGSGPLTYRWQRSDDDGGDYVDVPGATTTTLNLGPTTAADDGALFRLVVENPEGSATSDPARLTVVAGCPVPPFPDLVRTEPVIGDQPAATLGANLLANPSFEDAVWVGLQPTGTGYWRFDDSASVPAQQGIAPRSGDGMLQFVSASRDVTLFGSANASEQIQVVDVTGVQGSIDADEVRVRASAWFARVAGCSTTDDAFGVYVIAFDGEIGTYRERWANGITAATEQGVDRDLADMTGVDGWLLHRRVAMRHDDPSDRIETASGDVFDWRELTIEADVPAGTTLLVVVLYALENVLNDTAFPEFHGHYADDAEVVLELRNP